MKGILLLLVILLFMPSIVSAADYYVSPAGSASWPGCQSSATPCSLGTANANLQAGDTAYLMGGTYATSLALSLIKPSNSGSPDSYIAYKRYNEEVAVITITNRNRYAADLGSRSYIMLEGLTFKDCIGGWVNLSSGNHNIIQGCMFVNGDTCIDYNPDPKVATTCRNMYRGIDMRYDSDYNQILDNYLSTQCYPRGGIWVEGSHNLIQGNEIDNASAYGLVISGPQAFFNVIRNNTIHNDFHTSLTLYAGSGDSLIEGNMIYDSGEACGGGDCQENRCGHPEDRADPRNQHAGHQMGGFHYIVRNNLYYNNGKGFNFGYNYDHTDHHVYHNTLHDNYINWWLSTDNDTSRTNVKNNIISSGKEEDFRFDSVNGDRSEVEFANNCIYGSEYVRYQDTYNFPDIQDTYPLEWSGTIWTDPMFEDEAGLDFTLASDSPCRDAGTHLTKTIESRTDSDTLMVYDAGYFFSGQGLPWSVPNTAGDTIYIEDTGKVTISSIDYVTNTIILTSPSTWDNDKRVYHCPDGDCFSGTAPEIGAYEYADLCTEDWSCTDWTCSSCVDNQQDCTRTCTDQENCGTEDNKPPESETRTCGTGELVGHWTFDSQDISGSTLLDISGLGNHGTIHGATPATGRVGEALYFDGEGDYVVVDSNSLNVDYLTASLWFRADDLTDNAGLFAKGDNFHRQYWAWIYQGNLSIEIDEGNDHNHLYSLQTDVWYHLAVTYDGSSIIAYINGTEISSIGQITGTVLSDDDSLIIGRLPGFQYFNGTIDDVYLWNSSLTAQEILELYDSSFHAADDNPRDGCVEEHELIPFIDLWKYDSTTYPMGKVMDAVTLWSKGTGC